MTGNGIFISNERGVPVSFISKIKEWLDFDEVNIIESKNYDGLQNYDFIVFEEWTMELLKKAVLERGKAKSPKILFKMVNKKGLDCFAEIKESSFNQENDVIGILYDDLNSVKAYHSLLEGKFINI